MAQNRCRAGKLSLSNTVQCEEIDAWAKCNLGVAIYIIYGRLNIAEVSEQAAAASNIHTRREIGGGILARCYSKLLDIDVLLAYDDVGFMATIHNIRAGIVRQPVIGVAASQHVVASAVMG